MSVLRYWRHNLVKPEHYGRFLRALKAGRREARFDAACRSPHRVEEVPLKESLELRGEYFVTSERGLFLAGPAGLRRLCDLYSYGVAVAGRRLFLAASCDTRTVLLRFELPAELAPGRSLLPEPIYTVPMRESRGRVHQICMDGDTIWLTETDRNAISQVDAVTGRLVRTIYPFKDVFGRRIDYNLNHINGVFVIGDCVLFCCYRAGEDSGIGVVEGRRVTLYRVPNRGIHNVLVAGEALYYTDTFGGDDERGYLYRGREPIARDFCDQAPVGYAIRGLGMHEGELVIGHSHKGERFKRFKGPGSLLIGDRRGEGMREIVMPFAQVYDLLRRDGRVAGEVPSWSGGADVRERLSALFGEPIQEGRADIEEAR